MKKAHGLFCFRDKSSGKLGETQFHLLHVHVPQIIFNSVMYLQQMKYLGFKGKCNSWTL